MDVDKDIILTDEYDATSETKLVEPRADFNLSVIRDLYRSTGGLCSNCGCVTIARNPDTKKIVSIGEAAHIKGAKRTNKSPRSNSNSTDDELKSFDNGIWLCRNCHKQIDYDYDEFPSEKLMEMKVNAERKTYDLLHRDLDTGIVFDPNKFDLLNYSDLQKAFILEAINEDGFSLDLGDDKEQFMDPFYRQYGHKLSVKKNNLRYEHFLEAFQDFQASGFGDMDIEHLTIDARKLETFIKESNDDIENVQKSLTRYFERRKL